MPTKQSDLVAVPWDSAKETRKSWILTKQKEQVRFSRSEMGNGSFMIQKDQERILALESFQARDIYRKLIDKGYKLRR